MKRLSFLAAVLLCFVTAATAAIRPAQPGIGGSGGSLAVTVTNGYSFNGPFNTVNATNVYLNAALSNLVINPPQTNYTGTGTGASNRFLVTATGSRATNAFKRYYYDTNNAHNLSNLVAAAASGDIVELGAGTFNIGLQTIRIPVGVTLRGQGEILTTIVGLIGAPTNTPIQLMSSNILEGFTVVAGNRAIFQYPIGNIASASHTPATNVLMRHIAIDGETDCVVISQTDDTSVTTEDCNFQSAWDVFNHIDLNTGDGRPGARAIHRRTRFYSDSGLAVNPQALLDPKSHAFICEGAYVDLINCEITATNNKARAIICTGFETNLVRVYDGFINSAGTNGFGSSVDIATDSDNSVSKVNISGTLVTDANLSAGTVVTYEPRQIGSLRADTIRSLDDIFASDGLFARTVTVTNELQAETMNTGDLNASGITSLADTVVTGTFVVTAGVPGVGKVLTDIDGAGTMQLQDPVGGSTWTQDQNGGGFSLTNALSVSLSSSASGLLTFQSATSLKFLGFSVPDTLATGSTNLFSFASPAAGQTLKLLSTSNGVNTWTNSKPPITMGIMSGSFAPIAVANSAVYCANNANLAPSTTLSTIRAFRAPDDGVINDVAFSIYTTGTIYGSTNTITARLTNLTTGASALITSLTVSNIVRDFIGTGIGFNVASNDNFALMTIFPATWDVAPSNSWFWQGSMVLTR